MHASIFCLVIFEQAQWFNHGGDDTVADVHPENTKVAHGNSMMAATVCATVVQLVGAKVLDKTVFLTGATSYIGKAVALYLANKGFEVVCYIESQEEFKDISSQLPDSALGRLCRADTLACGAGIGTWVIGKYDHAVNDHMPIGCEAVIFSVRDPVNQRKRPDIHVTSGKDPL